MVITKMRQVEEIANKHFNCVVRPVGEIHAKGYLGIKLIVGVKKNPAFDPSIDENNPPAELLAHKDLLKNKTNPETADIRIIWMPPGTTDEELTQKWIIPIQESLRKMEPIPQKSDRTLTKINERSDADLAAEVAAGKRVDSRFEDFDEGYEEETDPLDAFKSKPIGEAAPVKIPAPTPVVKPKPAGIGMEDILDAINQVVDNMSVVSDDVGKLNRKIENIDTRLNEIENKPVKRTVKK